MRKILRYALVASAVLSAAPVSAVPRADPAARLAKVIGDRIPGTPTDCISLSMITSSEIIAGKAIVYRIGSTVYVNDPRSGASSLDEDDVLVTCTIGSQLCSIDTVNLVDRNSRSPRGFVSFGQFVPYAKVKPKG